MMTNIPSLSQVVLDALAFFAKTPPPSLDLNAYRLSFVVGSGNAINTGKIIFSGKTAIFADESDFRDLVTAYAPILEKKLITRALVISASGEKDSVWEVEFAKSQGLQTTLMTCKPQSSAAKIADKVLAYRSLAEPYTYNVSTYLGMILSTTGEPAEKIAGFVKTLALPPNFADYEAYSFVLPDKYLQLCPMLDIKKSELFGPHLSLRAFTEGHARHAKFVIPWEKELVIGVGANCDYFGLPNHRWLLQLPEFISFGAMLSLTYYLVGKIQEAKPNYYRDNIAAYCRDYGPKAYGKPEKFEVIVPGN